MNRRLLSRERAAASGRPFEWRTYEGLDPGLSPRVWDIGPWLQRFK